MTQRKHRGADALAQAIAATGARHVFTLSGNHVMPVFDAALDAGLELIHVRHEAAAVHMADAYARLTGRAGIALVTGGPGHANAVSALYTAAMAESPVVLLSGHAPNSQLGMGAFQEMRQADIAAPLCKGSWTATAPDAVAAELARAVRCARGGRPGPTHLSLPQDVLDGEAPRLGLHGDPFLAAAQALARADAEAIAAEMSKGRRPLVLAGPASMTRAGRARLALLERELGVPVIGMESPRGVNDPSLGDLASVLARADRVLLLGKRVDFTLKFGKAFAADCIVLQVDPEAAEIERAKRALGGRLQVAVVADVDAAIDTLCDLAEWPVGDWSKEVHEAVRFRPPEWDRAGAAPGRLHPVQMLRPLQVILDSHPDAVLVSDGGEIGQWAQACLAAPHRVINGVAGSIGAGLPFAFAARIAVPAAPVVAVMGDGTFGFHAAEIDTGVRYGLPVLAVVGNDARWNAEYQIQLREYGKDRLVGCELLPSRYDEVARAFGGHGELVTDAAQMKPAAERAMGAGLPAVLNVMIEGMPAPNIKR
jgi:acetolactate synthase-1/2/3 large subunit